MPAPVSPAPKPATATATATESASPKSQTRHANEAFDLSDPTRKSATQIPMNVEPAPVVQTPMEEHQPSNAEGQEAQYDPEEVSKGIDEQV